MFCIFALKNLLPQIDTDFHGLGSAAFNLCSSRVHPWPSSASDTSANRQLLELRYLFLRLHRFRKAGMLEPLAIFITSRFMEPARPRADRQRPEPRGVSTYCVLASE